MVRPIRRTQGCWRCSVYEPSNLCERRRTGQPAVIGSGSQIGISSRGIGNEFISASASCTHSPPKQPKHFDSFDLKSCRSLTFSQPVAQPVACCVGHEFIPGANVNAGASDFPGSPERSGASGDVWSGSGAGKGTLHFRGSRDSAAADRSVCSRPCQGIITVLR